MAGDRQPILIVLGIVGWIPVSGVTWQALHYLEGFKRLGFDVYYVEDTVEWPYDHEKHTFSDDPTNSVSYLSEVLAWCGLSDRWAYRFDGKRDRTFGLSAYTLDHLFQNAAILVNLTGATVLRPEHLQVPVRILIETDPFRPQVEVAENNPFTINLLQSHTHLATYAENIGEPDCAIPLSTFWYTRTRQPVILDWWAPKLHAQQPEFAHTRFTTISRWEQSEKATRWNGETYLWSKHRAFMQYLNVPLRTNARFEVALDSHDPAVIDLWESNGWSVLNATPLSTDIQTYQEFIQGSHGEFTVAKEQYVGPRTGWFSDRSACYLAAGKPVITQDTGFGRSLPTGQGLFAFSSMYDIEEAMDSIARDYDLHSRAATTIACQHFKAETVLARLLHDTTAGEYLPGNVSKRHESFCF